MASNFIGPGQADKTFLDKQGNFQGQLIRDAHKVAALEAADSQKAGDQFLKDVQQPLGQQFGESAGFPGPVPEKNIPILSQSEKRLETGRALVQAEDDTDKEDKDGFKFTDIFDLLGSFANDQDVAANSIGRLVGKATGQTFRSPEERKDAKVQQKADAQKAMALLLEDGRNKRAENRLDFTKEKFGENKELRKQDREIQTERIRLAKNQGTRLALKAARDKMDRLADTELANESLTLAADTVFNAGTVRAIADKHKAPRDLVNTYVKELKAMPTRNAEEIALKAAKAEEFAQKLSPSGAEVEQAPQQDPPGTQRLPSGALLDLATRQIIVEE